MPDFGVRIDTSYWQAASKDIDRASKRAAMWAVRECGRQAKRAAKRNAPVSTSTRKRVKVDGTWVDFQPGLLRKSIGSSRRLGRVGGGYSVKVAPRGGYVHLYAMKVEQRHGYMHAAYDTVVPRARVIHEKAMQRALRRYR